MFTRQTSSLIATGVVILLVVSYIIFSSTRVYEKETIRKISYHAQLSESILNGKITLEDYWDRDLTKYKGNIYVYPGIVTALLYLPLVSLFGVEASVPLFPCIIGILCFLVWLLILRKMQKEGLINFNKTSLLIFSILPIIGTEFFYLNMGCFYWNKFGRIGTWEAQAVSFLFMSLSVYFLIKKGFLSKLLASIMFSFAALSRASAFILAPLFILLGSFLCEVELYEKFNKKSWFIRVLRSAVILSIPILVGLAIQLYYNYLRYDDFMQFGIKYQTHAKWISDRLSYHGLVSFSYLQRNLRFYFLKPMHYSFSWPYVKPFFSGSSIWSYQFSIYIVFIALVYKITNIFSLNKNFPKIFLKKLTKTTTLVIGSILICFTCFFYLLCLYGSGFVQIGARYLMDVQPFLTLLIIISFNLVQQVKTFKYVSYLLVLATLLTHTLAMEALKAP